jgi:hypothetical protein
VVRLAIASVPQIAAVTGHSLKDVEAILDAHYPGRDIQFAEEAVPSSKREQNCKRWCKRRVASRSPGTAKCLKDMVGAPGLGPGTRRLRAGHLLG